MTKKYEEYINLLRSGHSLRFAGYYHKKAMKEIEDAINKIIGEDK